MALAADAGEQQSIQLLKRELFRAASLPRTLVHFPKLAQHSIPEQVGQTRYFPLHPWGLLQSNTQTFLLPSGYTHAHTTAVQNILVEDYDLHTVLSVVWLIFVAVFIRTVANRIPNYCDEH